MLIRYEAILNDLRSVGWNVAPLAGLNTHTRSPFEQGDRNMTRGATNVGKAITRFRPPKFEFLTVMKIQAAVFWF
jgi:hypothetical protein